MKRLYQIFMATLIGFSMNACYYDAYYDIPDDSEPTENVSYSADIQPLWDATCVVCHNGSEPPDLRPDTSYDALSNGWLVPGDAESSIIYQSLLGSNGVSLMPPGQPWPQADINLVRDWINQGALDN